MNISSFLFIVIVDTTNIKMRRGIAIILVIAMVAMSTATGEMDLYGDFEDDESEFLTRRNVRIAQ